MKKFIDESWLVLVMGAVFAVLLAGAQTVMKPKWDENKAQELRTAIAEVVPQMDPAKDAQEIKLEDVGVASSDLMIKNVKLYRCLATDGTVAGWAVAAEGTGFIDKIRLVAGISPDGRTLLGIKVIEHTETPGLGNKIERVEDNFYPYQYEGKATGQPFELVKTQPGQPHEIQAITGATYSSQYVMDIVNDILKRIVPQLPRE